MIIGTDENQNAQMGVENAQIGKFRIKESAKAFSILSSSLYKNPIRAIIRELSCNARDSHKESGQKQPWTMHLPSTMEPYFMVKDIGLGLSHDQVMRIYTTYFESTKSGSNDLIGGLGLGSKSPFSYTSNFTVTAVKNGTKNLYSAYLDDQACPAIVLMSSSETTDPNGVEIQFGVKSSDFSKFASEAQIVCSAFPEDEMPTGTPSYTVMPIRIETPAHNFFQTCTSYSNGDSHIRMGGVIYPIDRENISLAKYKSLLQNNIFFDCDIGTVDISPSRESLTYTQKTLDYILDKMEKIEASIRKDMLVKTSGLKSTWDKIKFIESYSGSTYGYFLGTMFKNWFYSSIAITNNAQYAKSKPKQGLTFKILKKNRTTWRRTLTSPQSQIHTWPDGRIFLVNDMKIPISYLTKNLVGNPSEIVFLEFDNINFKLDNLKKFLDDEFYGVPYELTSNLFSNAVIPKSVKKDPSTIVYRVKANADSYASTSIPFVVSREVHRQPSAGSIYFDLDDEGFALAEDGKTRLSQDKLMDISRWVLNAGNIDLTKVTIFGFKKNSVTDKSTLIHANTQARKIMQDFYGQYGPWSGYLADRYRVVPNALHFVEQAKSKILDKDLVDFSTQSAKIRSYNKQRPSEYLLNNFLTADERKKASASQAIVDAYSRKYPLLFTCSIQGHENDWILYLNEKYKLLTEKETANV